MIPEPTARAALEYETPEGSVDGVLTHLPAEMVQLVPFDEITVHGLPASKRITLWFRQGARRIFQISVLRRGGRCLIEFCGQDPAQVLNVINRSKERFDRWFGIQPRHILFYEDRQRHKEKARGQE
jgi:hypothetical protein